MLEAISNCSCLGTVRDRIRSVLPRGRSAGPGRGEGAVKRDVIQFVLIVGSLFPAYLLYYVSFPRSGELHRSLQAR